MQTVIQKCTARECVKFLDIFDPYLCPSLPNNMYVGNFFAKSFLPGFVCPIKRGEYLTTKNIVDMSRIDFLPFDDGKWMTSLEFLERDEKSEQKEKRPLGCWFFQMSRTTGRKRGGKGK